MKKMQEIYHFRPNQQQFPPNQQPFQQNQQNFQQQPVQHVIVLQIPMENRPVHTTCPSCHANICTNVTTETNAYTHMLAGLLCLMCCIPCVVIPYCCDTTKSSVHTCPQCNAYIGTYNPNHRSYNRRW